MTKREIKYHSWNNAVRRAKRWFVEHSMIPPDKADIKMYLNFVYQPKADSILEQMKPLMDIQTMYWGRMQDMIGIPASRESYDSPPSKINDDEPFYFKHIVTAAPKPGKTSHYIIPKRKKQ